MNNIPVWLYVAVMAVVTYIIRALPFTLFRKKIKNVFIRSLLYYLPYAVLASMTVPAVFSSTGSLWSGLAGCGAAVVATLKGKSLLFATIVAALAAFAVEMLLIVL